MTKTILAIMLLLFWCHPAWSAVTRDNDTQNSCGNTTGSVAPCAGGGNTQVSVTHVTGVGASGMLVFTTVDCDGASTAASVSTIQYAGAQNLAQITSKSDAVRRKMELWALPAATAPTTGSNALVVTLNADIESTCASTRILYVSVLTFTGSDTTTLLTDTKTGNGTGTTAQSTALASSGANDLVVLAACAGSSFSGRSGTSQWTLADGTIDCASQDGSTSAGGTLSPTATISGSDTWMSITTSIKASGGGGGDTLHPAIVMLLLLSILGGMTGGFYHPQQIQNLAGVFRHEPQYVAILRTNA